MNEKNRADKRHRAGLEIDGEVATIRFSPEVVRSLRELEIAVRDSDAFDPDLRVNLAELAAGDNFTVRAAITNIGLIVQETMEHIAKTDDEAAKLALFGLFDKLMGTRANSKPVTVIPSRGIQR